LKSTETAELRDISVELVNFSNFGSLKSTET